MTAPAPAGLPYQARAITWAAMEPPGRVIQTGEKSWAIDFGRKWPQRYLYTNRGVRFSSRKKAEGLLGTVEDQLSKGDATLDDILSQYAPRGGSCSIQEMLPAWLELFGKKVRAGDRAPRTLREYERWARQVPRDVARPENHFSYWYGRSLFDVSETELERWSYWLAERGLTGRTRNKVLSGFRVFLTYASKSRYGFEVPEFPWAEQDEREPTVLDLDLRDRVLEAIDEEKRGIFLALAWSGIRPSEARVLRVRDWQGLELDVSQAAKDRRIAPRALVRGPKKRRAKKRRGIAAEGRAGELLRWLEKHVPKQRRLADPDGPLFINSDVQSETGWWSESGMRRVWGTACKRVGVRVGLYEGTKHSLGTALKAAGEDDRVIADIFGHSDPRSVLPYARVQTATVRRALSNLERRGPVNGL